MDSTPVALQHMCTHVLSQLAIHRRSQHDDHQPHSAVPPLFVGVQGPQGSGKTFLTSLLRDTLTSQPHHLSIAVLSLDDLYLPHDALSTLASAHPLNVLLRGRGQPGTHDVRLGAELMRKLKRINEEVGVGEVEVEIPSFDKSLFGGEGDRRPHGASVRSPLDVLVLEGWCVGFYPVSLGEIDRRWELPVRGLAPDFFPSRGVRKEDVVDVNERLRDYVSLWETLDAFIQVCMCLGSFRAVKVLRVHISLLCR